MSQPTQKQGAVVRFNPKVQALSRCLRAQAKYGPEALTKFLASAEFDRLWANVPRDQRGKAGVAIKEARDLSYRRDKLPPPAAPLPNRGAGKRNRWKDPAEVARLRDAFIKAGPGEGQAERAGRLLGITKGAATLAYQRYVAPFATSGVQRAA